MKRLIFDIETVGIDFDSLDETSKGYMLRYAEDDKAKEEVKASTSFYPLTGEVVAIGMLNPDTDKSVVYYQNPDKKETLKEGAAEFISGNEKDILELFWKQLVDCNQFVTFNGRSFDCPFVMLRSAILKVKPTKNLMPYRYDSKTHVDLLDQMTFYGAMRRSMPLHMWCKAFGIKSPKEGGVTGLEVKETFRQKRYLDIARYCLDDVRATKELFAYWDKFIKF